MKSAKLARSKWILLSAVASVSISGAALGADQTWNNGGGDNQWNTTSNNWFVGPWNNTPYNGAIFSIDGGGGTLNATESINLTSINFTVDGWALTGSTLNFGAGSSTLASVPLSVGYPIYGPGVIQVADAVSNTYISNPITTSVGLRKTGAGTLVLNGAFTNTGAGIALSSSVQVDMMIGMVPSLGPAGAVKLGSSSVLSPSARVGIGSGYLDIGASSLTLSSLVFSCTNSNSTWSPTVNGSNGVVGTGTLHVTGDILVTGQQMGTHEGANALSVPLDLDNSEQLIRSGGSNVFPVAGSGYLYVTAPISNGSLTLTGGPNGAGAITNRGGTTFLADNTYTGATLINNGANAMLGTNASTSLRIITGNMALWGVNGSYANADTIQLQNGSSLALDSNSAFNNTGTIAANWPSLFPGTNLNRLSDNATIEMRDSSMSLVSQSTLGVTETIKNINATTGNNTITLTATGVGGSSTLTATGDLTLGSRAVMFVRTSGTGTLGNTSKLFVNGVIPAAEATGIFSRVLGASDLLTYSATTGFTPLAAGSYSTTLAAGTNVTLGAGSASVGSSVAINALKRTAAGSISITTGNTLTINSGVILNTSGTGTITGGTLALGLKPGVFVGNNFIDSAITGSDGIIFASGTGTMAGNLSGLAGRATVNGGTLHMKSTTFAGDIDVRPGATYAVYNQATAGTVGTVYLGESANDDDLVMATYGTLDYSVAGANAVIKHNIVIDNGGMTARGTKLDDYSFHTKFTPLSNAVTGGGTQTLSGNITLNSPVNLQGGGGGPGGTVFSGTISGPSYMDMPNGHAIFTGTLSNDGGFVVGRSGFTSHMEFLGTATTNAPVTFYGGNTTSVNNGSLSSFISYKNGGLPSGTLTLQFGTGTTAPRVRPVDNSVINNWVDITSEALIEPAAGITAEWAGTVAGSGTFNKIGAGALILSGPNTLTGSANITAGTLGLKNAGSLASATITINGGTLDVSTTTSTYSTKAGQTIATGPAGATIVGNFIHDEGTLSPGGLAAPGTLNAIGSFDISGGSILYTTSPSTVSGNDLINVTGATVANGVATVTLDPSLGVTSGAYTVLTASGGVTGDVSGWSVDTSAYSPGSTGTVAISGNNIVLNMSLGASSSLKWAGTSSGVWDTATTSNWNGPSGSAKFYVGDAVSFEDTYDGSNAPTTTSVTLNSLVVPSSINVNSSLNYSISGTGKIGGSGMLTKSGSGVLTLTTYNLYSGGTTINGGTINVGGTFTASSAPLGTGTIYLNGGALAGTNASFGTFSSPVNIGSSGGTFNFDGGSQVRLDGNIYGAGNLVFNSTNAFKQYEIAGSTAGYTGSVVIQAGRVVFTNAAAATTVVSGNGAVLSNGAGTLQILYSGGAGNSPQATLIASLAANAAGGFQTGKIRTTQAVNPTYPRAIGWSDSVNATTGAGTFSARLTYYGDANLSGKVDSTDFNALVNAANWGKTTGATWAQGDFNYDGKVNTLDFNLLAGNFGQTAAPGPELGPELGSVVPEPASLGLLGLAGLLMRRNRK